MPDDPTGKNSALERSILEDDPLIKEVAHVVQKKIRRGEFSSIDGFRKQEITINIEKIVIYNGGFTMSPTPQERYRHNYTLLAWGSGVLFLLLLLGITVLIPDPTPNQLRIWLPIMAIAAGGFATTITGILNVKAKLGTQLVVGATGAFGVIVLFYLFNPAVF